MPLARRIELCALVDEVVGVVELWRWDFRVLVRSGSRTLSHARMLSQTGMSASLERRYCRQECLRPFAQMIWETPPVKWLKGRFREVSW